MIEAYFRPETLEDAVQLIQQDPLTIVPLGGGNVLSSNDSGKIKVVDLQLLHLNQIAISDSTLQIGACTKLQNLVENGDVPGALRKAAIREGTINQRYTGTIAGDLVSTKGQSPLGAVLLAFDARVVTEPGRKVTALEEFLNRLEEGKPAGLITRFDIPLGSRTEYLDLSKTPEDVPYAFSTMSFSEGGGYIWILFIKEQPGLFVVKAENTLELTKIAYSHYNTTINHNSYIKQIIDVLFERLAGEIHSEGRGK